MRSCARALLIFCLVLAPACDDAEPLGGGDASMGDGPSSDPDGATSDGGPSDRGPGADLGGDAGTACAPITAPPEAVLTHLGPVLGTTEEGVRVFRGIPYARPPVGARRFRPPEEPGCFETPFEARNDAPMCPQFGASVDLIAGDEDCLYLNVWTPETEAPPRAVLFFVHGGGNLIGAGNQELGPGQNLYDGLSFAQNEDVIVVTANYRLGPLGFFAHPALDAESARGVSGNYALLDLIKALEWVQTNIAAFGGDPSRVLLFGESAGALNTCMLMTAPRARGLFSRALMESGTCQAPSLEVRQRIGTQISELLGCEDQADPVACFREASPEEWLRALVVELDVLNIWDLPYGPAVDGDVLPRPPIEVFRRGEQARVPLIIGTNAHETELFLPPIVNTCLDYWTLLSTLIPERERELRDLYPCTRFLLPRHTAVDVSTDLTFRCPARRIALAAAQSGVSDVFRYRYDYIRRDPVYAALRAFHASELALVFGTYDRLGYLPPQIETDLSRAMQSYWAQFAKTGDPNGRGLPSWPPYEDLRSSLLVLDAEITRATEAQPDVCDFWDALAD